MRETVAVRWTARIDTLYPEWKVGQRIMELCGECYSIRITPPSQDNITVLLPTSYC